MEMNNRSESSPTVVIVGGVAGGASAATRARRMNEDAHVILLEQGPYVSFANCGLPYYIGGEIDDRDDLLVATPDKFRRWFNVDVRTRHRVTELDSENHTIRVENQNSGDTYFQSFDKCILSPGATPIIPPLENTDSKNVFTLRDLPDTDRINAFLDRHDCRRAVLVGAGFIGLEMAEMLRRRDLEVHLVEMLDQVLPPLDPEMARFVERELREHGVELHLGNACDQLLASGDHVESVRLEDGTRVETDLVMMNIGVRPQTHLAEQAGLELGPHGGIRVNEYMQTSNPDVYAVGDAVEYQHAVIHDFMRVPLAGPANRAGRIAGQHAATGMAPAMEPVLGTAIVRVFDRAAAITGVNRKQAHQRGMNVESVWIPGKDHAGYFPGARPLQIKLLYDSVSGRVVGGQVVGEHGVDKRIDVLATVMHFEGTIDDVAGLDLAYSPPFGSAKDVVHQAGFAAQNQWHGWTAFSPPNLAGEDGESQWLDVRSPEEFEQAHLPESINIPLDQLRESEDRLDRERPVRVICGIGQRAYYAARILQQEGFKDVKVLGGGLRFQGDERMEE